MFKKIFNKKDMIELQDILRNNKKTITTAESCTGGLVASMITKVSGSSDIFNGSIVSYSNKIKNQELNVNNETLEKFGAVSTEVVNEMLDGAIKKFEADFAIAISGIAGPTGATKNKPVGTVVIGISDANNAKTIDTFYFKGTREEVQIQAAKTSLKKILKFVKKTLDN
ncbi:CinA family protein [Aliarcobacter butzleri]|uniref:Damage-inducible protein CinA n=1 Tax=Aliarcobacter butzleri L351 TaxID=1447259 RepID=A0A837J6G2_9BACT|nr:CinA family protein [Aliarcobacter butzleri]MCP3648529.1 CinA family protein [Arcobacter sp. DNRA7]KLE02045.1 damage-inducible protein CinA [Aliarcobacter butzleri L351]KLE12994.1 damage-inducible protein CinA [Aliarcobacter butzleri L350]MCG3670851.1 CinA family protein [Aliarcobacter butzleri]MCR1814702.1 CinA family protein [Aliarcobacter butzleri]